MSPSAVAEADRAHRVHDALAQARLEIEAVRTADGKDLPEKVRDALKAGHLYYMQDLNLRGRRIGLRDRPDARSAA